MIIMIDTGDNISLISSIELNEETIPTVPVSNISLIGATGRQNKTIKRQALLDITSDSLTIPTRFLVADNLPLFMLIGCYIMHLHSAIINLNSVSNIGTRVNRIDKTSYTNTD